MLHFGDIRYENERLLRLHPIGEKRLQIALEKDLGWQMAETYYGPVLLSNADNESGCI